MSTKHRYQVMPDHSPEEYAALKADIALNGVKYPKHVDEEDNTLDGHARQQICDELGIECPKIVIRGMTDAQKREHAWQVNLTRRHLSKAQKRQIAGTLWREGWTQERIAHALGVSQPTIVNWLPQVINSDDLANFPTVEGKDGKRQRRVKGRRGAAPQPEGSSLPGTPLRPDADDCPAQKPEQQDMALLRDADPESRSPLDELRGASDTPDPLETPLSLTDEFRGEVGEQRPSTLASNPVPPAEDDAEGQWVGALQDVFVKLETLRMQGGSLPQSTRWAPETRARGMATIQRMQETLMELAAVVAADMGETTERNGHDGGARPSPVPPPSADEMQAQGNRKRVTRQSAEASIGDAADGDQLRSGGAGEGSSPRDQVLPVPEEEKPSTQALLAALRSPARPAERKDAPARTRTRRSKQAVANGHASSAPLQTAPDHPPPDASQSQGGAATIGNPGPHHDEDAVEPDADAARPIGASAPADNADLASVDLTSCGSCGGTQFIPTPRESGRIYCECGSVYNPSTGHWAPGRQDKRQRPLAPVPVTPA
jgi:ParB-like chromosome segregation protein Spo0J